MGNKGKDFLFISRLFLLVALIVRFLVLLSGMVDAFNSFFLILCFFGLTETVGRYVLKDTSSVKVPWIYLILGSFLLFVYNNSDLVIKFLFGFMI